MKKWHFNESGEQRGPVSEDEIKSMLAEGKIKSATLVWAEGMTDWKPAGSVFEVAVSPYAPPISEPETTIDHSGFSGTGEQIRPWVRYWARTSDFLLFCMIVGAVIFPFFPQMVEINDALLGALMLAVYTFIEPIFFAIFGTTPFKALLNIRVRNEIGSKLKYGQALRRTASAWMRGQGLGIPIVSLFTNVNSYKHLTRDQITSWDRDGNFRLIHQKIAWWRWLILWGGIAMFVWATALGMEL